MQRIWETFNDSIAQWGLLSESDKSLLITCSFLLISSSQLFFVQQSDARGVFYGKSNFFASASGYLIEQRKSAIT